MSSQIEISVIPAPYVKPTVDITGLQIRVMNVILFTSASINVVLTGDNNSYIDCKQYILSGADYTNWANDDNYIVNYVLAQLGLTKT